MPECPEKAGLEARPRFAKGEPVLMPIQELLQEYRQTGGPDRWKLIEHILCQPDAFTLSSRVRIPLLMDAVSNPHTSRGVLEWIALGAPDCVLERVAEHPNASRGLLTLLSMHPSETIRAAVAQNNNMAQHTLELLLEDSSPTVRHALAENYALPTEALSKLLDDENPYVAHRAARTLRRKSNQDHVPSCPPELRLELTRQTYMEDDDFTCMMMVV